MIYYEKQSEKTESAVSSYLADDGWVYTRLKQVKQSEKTESEERVWVREHSLNNGVTEAIRKD